MKRLSNAAQRGSGKTTKTSGQNLVALKRSGEILLLLGADWPWRWNIMGLRRYSAPLGR